MMTYLLFYYEVQVNVAKTTNYFFKLFAVCILKAINVGELTKYDFLIKIFYDLKV